jgi:hypothetical protein
MYPVLRRHNESLALGAVAFRSIEGVFYGFGALSQVALFAASQQASGQAAAVFPTIRHLLSTMHDLAGFVLGVIAFCAGGLMYYIALYRARLLPRWISSWGIVALVLLLTASVYTVLDGEPYAISGSLIYLAIPIAIQELVMAVWLIVKGFNPAVIGPAVPDVVFIPQDQKKAATLH